MSSALPHRPAYRRVLALVCSVGALVLGGWATAHWAWRQPFVAPTRERVEITRLPAPTAQPVPVQDVQARRIADTFGAPRGRDRTHAGVDIFATRGTPVLSATRGIDTSVREGGLGGRQVWELGPALQRHNNAHLDDWAPGLVEGAVVRPGDVLGVVGDTGNARGTPPHLHYGVYGLQGAIDPLPRLRAGSTSAQVD